MSAFCPHCGLDIEPTKAITVENWRITPWSVEVDGKRSRLRPGECRILYSLAAVPGWTISRDVLVARACRTENAHANAIRVMVWRIRKMLPGVPIQAVAGEGYRWAA